MKKYGYRKSYIWGKKFGVEKGNVQIAAGGFIGVSRAGDYKLFGRAKAVGHAFGKTKTALDFLVLRQKSSRSTRSKLYANVIGKTLINVDVTQESSVCKRYSKPLHSSKSYKLFSLRLSIFIYVGTLKFSLSGYVKLNTDMYVQFCENRGSITAAAGLTPTITMTLSASATANILVSSSGFLLHYHILKQFISSGYHQCKNPLFTTGTCQGRDNSQCRVQLPVESRAVNYILLPKLPDQG